jgi:hypothetical protein
MSAVIVTGTDTEIGKTRECRSREPATLRRRAWYGHCREGSAA